MGYEIEKTPAIGIISIRKINARVAKFGDKKTNIILINRLLDFVYTTAKLVSGTITNVNGVEFFSIESQRKLIKKQNYENVSRNLTTKYV